MSFFKPGFVVQCLRQHAVRKSNHFVPTIAHPSISISRLFSSAATQNSEIQLPPRTIPEDKLRFKIRTYLGVESDQKHPLTPHGIDPAEFKVVMQVSVDDLGLEPSALERLKYLVGPRYDKQARQLKLVSNRFPNRIENKRYLVYLLENLLAEARRAEGGAS